MYYGWSRTLVHLLGPSEFTELRTNRNCYKIEPAEQAILRTKTVGVAGLSVGRASVVTMVLEGVGGRFRLADFDRLELSNLNRLRCSVADLGTNKAVLAARELFEIDPYVDVEVFEDGITDENLDTFLQGDGRLDLLVEECDELSMKLLLREHCRTLGIPVVMETSDRGLLDIERFDTEPSRPVLHGLVGDVAASSVRGLSDQEKVPFALKVLGVHSMSPQLGASLVEIGESITGWPQLASAVALGGGLLCDASRRLLLGQLNCSGRFYLDLDDLVSENGAVPLQPYVATDEVELEQPALPQLRRRTSTTAAVEEQEMRAVAAYSIRAPSGGNNQGWSFAIRGSELDCEIDPARVQQFLEFDRTGSTISVGAAAENAALAAAQIGLRAEAHVLPDPQKPELICRLRMTPDGSTQPDPLALQMDRRCTTRARGPAQRLQDHHADALSRFAESSQARVSVVRDASVLAELADVMGTSDRLALQHERVHRELMDDIRWTSGDVAERRDGLDARTFDVRDFERAAMRVVDRWAVMEHLRRFDGGSALETATRRAVAESAAMVLVSMDRAHPADYFEGGRAMQRLWLRLSELSIAVQPMTVLPALLNRLTRGKGVGFDDWHRERLGRLRPRFDTVFPRPSGSADIILFRLTYAPIETRRSARRKLTDVVRVESAP